MSSQIGKPFVVTEVLENYLKAFRRIASRVRPSLEKEQIEVHVGSWLGSAAVKLQKPRWSGEKPVAAPATTGIFFSVWIEEKSLKKNRVFYNVHALRLRNLGGYTIQSREFAGAFRTKFAPTSGGWPNVSVDYGPQTLMQGWIELNPAHLENDVVALVCRFVPLASTIDALLEERKN